MPLLALGACSVLAVVRWGTLLSWVTLAAALPDRFGCHRGSRGVLFERDVCEL